MPDENLLKYIRDGLAMGRTEDVLRTLLARSGWSQGDMDAAFKAVHEGAAAGAPQSQPQPQPQSQPQVQAQVQPQPGIGAVGPAREVNFVAGVEKPLVAASQMPLQPQSQPQSKPLVSYSPAAFAGGSGRPGGRKTWTVGLIVGLLVAVGGGWAAYAYFMPPSPQHVLDAMFQKDFTNINSIDSNVAIAADLHITPASSSASAASSASSAGGSSLGLASLLQGGGDPLSALTQMASAQGPSDVHLAFEVNGTEIFAPQNEDDENMSTTIMLSGKGQSVSFTVAGESRTLPDALYMNIASVPSLGMFDPSVIEGKWIAIPFPTSTRDAIANAGASTTLSVADRQKLALAAEGMIKIVKALPDGTIGGVPSYHYAYTIDQTGVDDFIDALAAVAAAHLSPEVSSTAIDASTTAQAKDQVNAFLGAFQGGLGGELWIGKSDYYPHQITVNAVFSTSTPEYGAVDGTVGVTTTITNINGGQTITAPANAESFGTLFATMIGQAMQGSGAGGGVASFNATQAHGRDARRLSDLQEIQNALQLYYDKCGTYPGGQVAAPCMGMTGRGFNAMELTILNSRMGVTTLPNDPVPGHTYYYGVNADGSSYILAATMEESSGYIFSNYTPPPLAGYAVPGLVSCAAPTYCLSL